jgi:hypothetical protein
MSLFQVPQQGPYGIDACLQSLFYLSFRVPNKGALSPGTLHRVPIERERDAPPPKPLSTIS